MAQVEKERSATPGSRGRQLIAILHADMVGYSRLMGEDDIGTVRRIKMLRRALLKPAIREFSGTLVDSAGDAMLILFDSIEGAVRCAIRIQQMVPFYDQAHSTKDAIRFRIGINI